MAVCISKFSNGVLPRVAELVCALVEPRMGEELMLQGAKKWNIAEITEYSPSCPQC